MRKVVFRADASDQVGAGHLMRSVALAQYLHSVGIEVLFFTASIDTKIRQYLGRQGFRTEDLDLPVGECGTELDLRKMLTLLPSDADWVILDNDYFGYSYQKAIRQSGSSLLVIDDRNERQFDADLLVNHALDAEGLRYDLPLGKTLLGSSFAMIRQEFIRYPSRRKKGVKNLLVTLGGSIQSETGKKIMAAVQGLSFDVRVLGGFSEERQISQTGTGRIEWIPATLEVAPHYDWADLAICAGGGTCWELCFFGIVGIAGALAPHQLSVVGSLERYGLFHAVGSYEKVTAAGIAKALVDLAGDPGRLEARREKAKELVDGKGTQRICDAMRAITTARGKTQDLS
ncbi:MAG: hypothetical protein V1882_00480 [Candidatus Omnitrophota bacterium]